MKKVKRCLFLICLFTLVISLSSCMSEGRKDTEAQGGSIKDDTIVAQIEYYEDLIEELRKDLLNAKEESFIAKSQYRAEIDELESRVLELIKTGASLSADSDEDNDMRSPCDKEEMQKEFQETALSTALEYATVNKKLAVCRYGGDGGSVTIPQQVNGVAVRLIGDEAFKDSDVITVSIPNGVEEIGWFAFFGCRSLKEVKIPASVTSIGYGAFEYCSSSLTIICERGSYAEAYAKSWGIKYIIE